MVSVEELKQRAKSGDLYALQELRDRGFFEKKKPAEKSFAVSHAQQRLWILDQMSEDSAAYNMPGAVLLEGPLNRDGLIRALEEVIRRHESLRTTFREERGETRQVIHETFELFVDERDLRLEPDPDHAAREYARHDLSMPFDLQRGPLYRVALLQLAEERYVFYFNIHHIVCDEWSLGVLVDELGELYNAFVQGTEPHLPDLRIHYKDFAAWQNQLSAGTEIQPHREYWHRQLAGDIPLLNWQPDAPRPPVLTFNGKTYFLKLGVKIVQDLTRLAAQYNATPFMTYLALVKTLLHRYTGQDEIVVGSPVAGRDHPDLEHQIGFYVNNLVLRDRIAGEESFIDIIQRVKRTAEEAYAHQIYPFDCLVDELHLERDMSRSPFFDVVVALQHAELKLIHLGDVRVSSFEINLPVAKYDLTFDFTETDDGVLLGLNYNTNLFRDDTIRRMSGHFERLARGVVANPRAPIHSHLILSDEERHRLTVEFNSTSASYPHGKTVVDLFEAQVESTPDRPAVSFEHESWTYRELNEIANGIAWTLRDTFHIQPEERIAVLLERSHWTIAGLLGIIKAGGTYVPLDPDYPEERLRFMCEDAGCRLILVDAGYADMAERCRPVSAERWDKIDIHKQRSAKCWNPPSAIEPDSTVYVIYTSGSTGLPKGCLVTHRNLVRLFKNDCFQFDFGESDVWIVAHSFCFDFSVWEMYGALLYGGKTVVARREDVKNVEAFRELLHRHRVTVLNQTPAAFYNLIAYETSRRDAVLGTHLRYVIFGGDRLDPTVLRPWVQRYPLNSIRTINMYGITETTVHVTYYEIGMEDIFGSGGRSPIGGPIPETTVYVCDPWMNLQPIGVAGEIYVGGTGVCRGYLNRPELTAGRFIDSPFRSGERLYRSGDEGRWLADGTLEHLGRNDSQVQLRGFRIEPGEIQAALNAHPGVSESVVIARDNDPDRIRLVAYIVPDREKAAPVYRYLTMRQQNQTDDDTLYELPNGMAVAHLNASETDFVYDEIFIKRSYLRYGITLRDGDCVFDVGANIGLFSLFAARECPHLSIYAFEPIPPVFERLKLNTDLYGLQAKVYNCGLSRSPGHAEFTYYPFNSVISGRYADAQTDAEVVKNYLLQRHVAVGWNRSEVEDRMDELLAERLQAQRFECRLVTLSSVIRENNLEKIDLLKVDVEKSELEVLQGIEENDWSKIRQIVAEVHDAEGRLQAIVSMLRARGFEVTVEQEDDLQTTGLYNVFARRPVRERVEFAKSGDNDPNGNAVMWCSVSALLRDVRDSLRQRLPDYMVPAYLIPLAAIPLTANGKVNRTALPEPVDLQGATQHSYVAPRNDLERSIAAIWSELLGRDRIGIHDNFFDLGGHSLKATQLVARIHRDLEIKISLRNVFQTPTIAGLLEYVQGGRRESFSEIPRIPAAADYPVSYAQRRLWVIESLSAERAAYNIVGAIRVQGGLDAIPVRRVLETLVERHESLRTTFIVVDDEPHQVVHPSMSVDFITVDLSSSACPEDEARRRIERDAAEPFALHEGPLFRTALYRLADEEFVFAFNMHHIISDGWSLAVFFKEFQTLYSLFQDGGRNPLAPLPIQYKDYAQWQNQMLSGREVDLHRAYWHERFAGEIPVLELPLDRPRPSVQTFRGDWYRFDLSPAIYQKLIAVGRDCGASAFAAVTALVKSWLYRYTGQNDIVVGTPVAGRDRTELENQIGFYANTLALRDTVDGNSGFRSLLLKVQETVTGALEHQIYPFDRLVEELDLKRDMGRSPLFDVAVSLLTVDRQSKTMAGLRIAPFDIHAGISKFDMTFFFAETEDGGCEVGIEYSTDLFYRERIERIAGHFHELARSASADPALPLYRLPLLPASERRLVVESFNQTQCAYPRDRTIVECFEKWVETDPDCTAVVCGDRTLTYRELNRKANALAEYLLLKYHLAPEKCVAVLLDRSEWTIVALLGVLKAGGAYVPIDPAYPSSRIGFILRDTGCRVLLTEPQYLESLSSELECVDAFNLKAFHSAREKNLPHCGTGDSLVYVIYTSGSTGQPKGSSIEQHSVLRLVLNTNYIHIKPDDRILQTGSLAFDASTFEIWGALLNGACVCLPDHDVLLDAAAMKRAIVDNGATVMFLTTSLFNQFVETNAEMFRPLRELLMGGEKVSVRHVNRLLEVCPDVSFSHVYGPTENTTFTTYYPVQEPCEFDIPIGAGIANTTVYILDAFGQPVPIGVPGEIYTGGDGLARGYLNQPELTAEKFVDDPFHPGQRLYRTGDLGYWREDGVIVFVSRIDNQVKVRGFRVELSEIENRLARYPDVREVVAIARETSVGTKELVAYFTAARDISAAELRAYLAQSLPEYMIPAHFVCLERIPLTVNGKVDRRRLPEPVHDIVAEGDRYVAPRTEGEKLLARIWQEVLGRDSIGVDECYFDLGGDSIRAIQIVSRVKQVGWQMGVRDLFQHPTIAGLAPLLKMPEPETIRGTVVGFVPLTPIQRWFFETYPNRPDRFNQAVLLRAHSRLDEAALRDVLHEVHHHHDMLRTVFRVENETIQQFVQNADAPIDFSVVDCSCESNPPQFMAAHIQNHQCFCLECGPLWRAVLYRLPDSDRLWIAAHHLVVDGVSWRILLEDIERGYTQHKRGGKIALGARSDSYQAWAMELERYTSSGSLKGERRYWKEIVHAAGTPLSAEPLDMNDNTYGASRTVHLRLARQETDSLLTGTHHAYHTETNDLLLTALGRALKRWHGGNATWITLEGHGREPFASNFDVGRTVGWFTTMFPHLLAIEGDDCGEQIVSVKESLRRIPHKGFGYGLIRFSAPDELRLAYSECIAPQISFNYLGQYDESGSDGWFSFADESSGEAVDPKLRRLHEWDVTGIVVRGCLELSVTYNPGRYKADAMLQWLSWYREELNCIAGHCRTQTESLKTPSDFTSKIFTLSEYRDLMNVTSRRASDIEDVYRLTPMQEGLLFHTLYQPDSRAYCLQTSYTLEGELDLSAFETAWRELCQRHAIFRTAFVYEDLSSPVQVVLKQRTPEIHILDWSDLDEIERAERIRLYQENDRRRGFDLQRDPLIRVTAFVLGEKRFRVLWSYHHIVMDGWCLSLVYRDWFAIYAACSRGRSLELPAPPRYASFIQWLENQNRQSAQEYWAGIVSDFDQKTTIPRTAEADPAHEYRLHETFLTFDERETAELTVLAAQNGVTLNTVVQSLWAIVLSRYSDRDDVVFGAIVSGRPPELPGVEEMVGLFINAIPVRVRLDESETFVELLHDLQKSAVESEPYHFYPLADIQSRSPAGPDMFDHLLIFANYPAESESIQSDGEAGLLVCNVEVYDQTHYDFNLIVVPGNHLQIKFHTNSNVYPPDQVERISGHLQTVVRRILRDPQQRLGDVDILPDLERHRLDEEFNATAILVPADRTVVDWFNESVARYSDRSAVIFGDVVLTYDELNARADRIARYLMNECSIKPESRIGLLMDRSEWMVAAVWGVLKAGGAYMPIDPGYPRERIEFLIHDSDCAVILADEGYRRSILEYAKIPIVDVRSLSDGDAAEPTRSVRSEHLAYIIYTSGSTGVPKGCQIEHRNLYHYLNWANRFYFQDEAFGNFGLYSPLSFDLTVTSLFLSLLRGKTLTVFPQDAEVGDILSESFRPGGLIDSIKLTPAHITLLNELNVTSTDIRLAIVGGEALLRDQVSTLHRLNPEMIVVNEYGPTETTVGCIVKKIGPDEKRILVGKPIANTKIKIVDRCGRNVPIGIPGEITIGGAGVGRGYWRRDELNAFKFISDPDCPGGRLYRSGDLGSWLSDGNIDYLGRADDQVKIRGHRVELGEIENRLLMHPLVEKAVVVLCKTDSNDPQLVAYVVMRGDVPVDRLREGLATNLPAYMIPAVFVPLDRIPLTPNGKVDRKALPGPAESMRDGAIEAVAPRNDIESKLVQLWRDILQIETVGVTDNFFSLGGHSLKAMQLVSRIQKELGVKISLRMLFQSPTIAELAVRVHEGESAEIVSIPPAPRQDHYELSHAQKRLWLLHRMDGETAYNMPKAYLFEESLNVAALKKAFCALVERHEALRTAFVLIDGEPRQKILDRVDFEVSELDLRGCEDALERARAIVDEEAVRPFDLEKPPLLRALLLDLPGGRYVLMLTMHHIIGDGWSMNVLYREILALYDAFCRNEPSPLKPLRIQYKDFTHWQNNLSLERDERYWLNNLKGVPERLSLQYDFDARADRDFRGKTENRRIPPEVVRGLRIMAETHQTTLSTVVLSIFQLVLFQFTKQCDFCVGLSVANRNHPDLENSIGFFVNILPIRSRLSEEMEFDELLAQTIERCHEAFERQDYPFDRLIEKLNPDRVSNRQPLVNVIYGFQNFDDVFVDVGGSTELSRMAASSDANALTTLQPFEVSFETSKFDLTLFVTDMGGDLLLSLEYDTGLFTAVTIQRYLETYERFAEVVSALNMRETL